MTFLQLVQEFVLAGGIAGQGGPYTVNGQTGEYGRAVAFVRLAHEEVCSLHADWQFLWAHGDTVADEAVIEPPADLGTWDAERIYLDGEPLPVIRWKAYTPESASPARPHQAILQPDGRLRLHPAPDKPYPLAFDYWRVAPRLEADNDESPIPARFRRVVVGRALILLGNYEFAEDVMKQGTELYQQYLDQLERHQLPDRQQTMARHASVPITVVAE